MTRSAEDIARDQRRAAEEARRLAELQFIALYRATHGGKSPSRHEITAFLQDTRR